MIKEYTWVFTLSIFFTENDWKLRECKPQTTTENECRAQLPFCLTFMCPPSRSQLILQKRSNTKNVPKTKNIWGAMTPPLLPLPPSVTALAQQQQWLTHLYQIFMQMFSLNYFVLFLLSINFN